MTRIEILDREFLAGLTGGRSDLLGQLLGFFRERRDPLLEDIRRAVSRADTDALSRAAGQLRMALGNVGARAATAAALDLERLGQRGSMTGLEDALHALEHEMQRLSSELESLGAGPRD